MVIRCRCWQNRSVEQARAAWKVMELKVRSKECREHGSLQLGNEMEHGMELLTLLYDALLAWICQPVVSHGGNYRLIVYQINECLTYLYVL
jgi:hypothetical protein